MITDASIVKFLLLNTKSNSIFWYEHDGHYLSVLYETTENRIDVQIYLNHTRDSGELICIRFSPLIFKRNGKPDFVYLFEPRISGFFKKYQNEEEVELAELLKQLYAAVWRQCGEREIWAQRNEDSLKQTVFKQILGLTN